MIKAVIIDDEINSIDVLRWQIAEYTSDVTVVGSFSSPSQAMTELPELNPDVVFLDIEMPGMNGFEFLAAFENINFEVIFVTAYNEFAIKAFKYSAMDYLLKPVTESDLVGAVSKLTTKVTQKKTDMKQYQLFFDQLKAINERRAVEKIALSTRDGLLFTNISEIIYCESDRNYTYVHLNNGTRVLVSKTLKMIEEILCEGEFLRVSQSFLVNLLFVKEYIRNEGGYVIMSNGITISISNNKKKEFLDRFSKF
jgi:two-component system LytT family response regulator